MKLVGATNGFIRSPFIIEGMIQGIIAGSISVVLMYTIFEYVLPFYLPEMGILDYHLVGGTCHRNVWTFYLNGMAW